MQIGLNIIRVYLATLISNILLSVKSEDYLHCWSYLYDYQGQEKSIWKESIQSKDS